MTSNPSTRGPRNRTTILFMRYLFSRRRGSNSKRRDLHPVETGGALVPVGPVEAEVDSVRVEAPRSSATRAEVRHPPTPRGDVTMKHEACQLCGMAESPPWRGPSKRQGLGLVCGRCGEWLNGPSAVDPRDLAAAVLAGIATDTHRVVPRRIGELVGLQFFAESGRLFPNSAPWEHVDVPALRCRVVELAEARHFRLPSRWDASRAVSW